MYRRQVGLEPVDGRGAVEVLDANDAVGLWEGDVEGLPLLQLPRVGAVRQVVAVGHARGAATNKYNVGNGIYNTVPYRTVPYRTVGTVPLFSDRVPETLESTSVRLDL